jgi:hypothetical protein
MGQRVRAPVCLCSCSSFFFLLFGLFSSLTVLCLCSVAQMEMRDERIRNELREMAKPLARHADDEDMNKVGLLLSLSSTRRQPLFLTLFPCRC